MTGSRDLCLTIFKIFTISSDTFSVSCFTLIVLFPDWSPPLPPLPLPLPLPRPNLPPWLSFASLASFSCSAFWLRLCCISLKFSDLKLFFSSLICNAISTSAENYAIEKKKRRFLQDFSSKDKVLCFGRESRILETRHAKLIFIDTFGRPWVFSMAQVLVWSFFRIWNLSQCSYRSELTCNSEWFVQSTKLEPVWCPQRDLDF